MYFSSSCYSGYGDGIKVCFGDCFCLYVFFVWEIHVDTWGGMVRICLCMLCRVFLVSHIHYKYTPYTRTHTNTPCNTKTHKNTQKHTKTHTQNTHRVFMWCMGHCLTSCHHSRQQLWSNRGGNQEQHPHLVRRNVFFECVFEVLYVCFFGVCEGACVCLFLCMGIYVCAGVYVYMYVYLFLCMC